MTWLKTDDRFPEHRKIRRRITSYNVCYTKLLRKVGGIRIRALSHIDGPMDAPIIKTRGQGGTWHVEPLTADAIPVDVTEPTPDQVAGCTDFAVLNAWIPVSRPIVRASISKRIADLERATASAEQGPLIPDHAAPSGGQ